MKLRRLLALVLSLVMVASVISACGNGTNSQTNNQTGNDAPPANTGSMNDEQPEGTVIREKVVVALDSTPTSLDPQTGDTVANKIIWNCTHESLLGIDPEKNVVVPELAKDYEISEDGLTYTFHLNEGIKFHNGETLTANDVVYTYTRAFDMPDVAARLGNLESITAVDETTVEMKLKAVNQDWAFICADQLFSILSEKACTEDEANGAAIGTGPFFSTLYSQNEKVSLERFEDYWGEVAPTKYIDFRVITEASSRSVALQNDEVQAITSPDPIELPVLQGDENLNVIQATGANVKYLAFNSFDDVTNNQLIRQAIACALNRDEVILSAVNGMATPAYTMWGPNVYGYNPDVKTFDYDVEQAKQLLAETGYPDGISIELVTTDSMSIQAQMIQSSLKEAGIEVTINTMDSAGMKNYRLAHEDQMSLQSVSYASNADDMRWSFGAEGSGNRGGFVVPEFDELLDVCMSSSDEAVRQDACTQIQELNAELCWYIPVYADLISVAANADVAGVVVNNVGIHDFSRITCAE